MEQEPVETEAEAKEFDRLLTWFTKSNKRIAWSMGLDEVVLVEGDFYGKIDNKVVRVVTKGKKKK